MCSNVFKTLNSYPAEGTDLSQGQSILFCSRLLTSYFHVDYFKLIDKSKTINQ